MNLKHLLLATATLTILTLSARAQEGGVAVLDLDAVARELGVSEQVRVDLEAMQNRLNTNLQDTRAQMQNQMNSVENAAGEEPDETQRQEILATNQQLNAQFNRLKTQAQQQLAQERARLINDFRNQLKPVALMAAKQKGLDVVLMKVSPPVLAYVNEVDITQATTELAVEAGLKIENPTPRTDSNGDASGGSEGDGGGQSGGSNGGGQQGDSGEDSSGGGEQ